jgi:integrase
MTDALRPSELFAIRWRTFDDQNTVDLTETIYRGEIRPYGKTPKSLGKMHLPDDLAEELRQWKLECPDPSPDAPMFPNVDGGFMDTSNYRNRVLTPLAESLEIPKLNFQVIRRTIATRAQSLGSVKDIQSHLRHSRADTTANEYMQELPEGVQQMVGTVYSMLTTTAMQQQANAGMSR